MRKEKNYFFNVDEELKEHPLPEDKEYLFTGPLKIVLMLQ